MISPAKAWTLVLAGDLMFNAIAPGPRSLNAVARTIQNADLAFPNLEVPLTTASLPTPNKSAKDLLARTQFVLKADPRHAQDIAQSGFDAVSLGNNHCMDYRGAGLEEMTSALGAAGVSHAGAGRNASEALKIAVLKTKNGTRVGLLSALCFLGDQALGHCTPAKASTPGINVFRFGGIIDDRARGRLAVLVKQAKTKCDVLVVATHWGIERQTLPTSYQVSLGRALIDAGADVVWGHHPHVLQGAELYRGHPILYSMGNFVSPLGASTALAKLKFSGKTFQGFQSTPCAIQGGTVRPKPGLDPFVGLGNSLLARYPNTNSHRLP